MLQFIKVIIVDETDERHIGTGGIKIADISAVKPTNNPNVCQLVLAHEIISVMGSSDYFINALENWVGSFWDATDYSVKGESGD